MKEPDFKWEDAQKRLQKLIGKRVKEGTYVVKEVDDKGLTLMRYETGSIVRVTRKMTEKTFDILCAGNRIPHRKISYTVAVEFGVLLALGDAVEDEGNEYVLAGTEGRPT